MELKIVIYVYEKSIKFTKNRSKPFNHTPGSSVIIKHIRTLKNPFTNVVSYSIYWVV